LVEMKYREMASIELLLPVVSGKFAFYHLNQQCGSISIAISLCVTLGTIIKLLFWKIAHNQPNLEPDPAGYG
jgi:hypothetical protein